MSRRSRRWLIAGVTLLLTVAFLGPPAYHLLRTALRDKNERGAPPPGFVDDASRRNEARMAEVWDIPADPAAAESQLRDLLQHARVAGLRVAIAGARHTMGGHTIYPDGIALNMLPFRVMELDEGNNILHVGAGARWSEIIPYLDQRGRSVAIMQSNNTFSVGGSLSANCHGWQHNQPPIASSVEAFRLMRADGSVVRCNRAERAELFSLVLGGYGLFGVILDVDLRVVVNERYRLDRQILASADYPAWFDREVNEKSDVGMVFGRLSVVPGEEIFLQEAILYVLRRASCPKEEIPPLTEPGLIAMKRAVFRGSVESDYGKRLRWNTEKNLGGEVLGKFYSRNQLLNEAVELFEEHSAERTDILHEYFLPAEQFTAFLDRCRRIIPKHQGNLLNVTVRTIRRDPDTLLRYADRDVFAFVMLFNQKRTSEGDERMAALTRDLIDAALELGGRYYLPYRLDATPEQFRRAYPQAAAFFERKRLYDPEEIFQNQFYVRYGGK